MNIPMFNMWIAFIFLILSRETFNDCSSVSSLFSGFSGFYVFSEVSITEISVLRLLNLSECSWSSDISKLRFSSSFSSDKLFNFEIGHDSS